MLLLQLAWWPGHIFKGEVAWNSKDVGYREPLPCRPTYTLGDVMIMMEHIPERVYTVVNLQRRAKEKTQDIDWQHHRIHHKDVITKQCFYRRPIKGYTNYWRYSLAEMLAIQTLCVVTESFLFLPEHLFLRLIRLTGFDCYLFSHLRPCLNEIYNSASRFPYLKKLCC